MEVLVVSKYFTVRDALGVFFSAKFKEYKFNSVKQLDEVENMNLSKVEFMLIDLDVDLIETISNIKKVFRNIKIVVFDRMNNKDIFLKSVKNKIDGYLVDVPEKEDLFYIVKKVLSGKRYYDVELVDRIVTNQQDNTLNVLTSRENEVLQMVGNGLSNKEISKQLYITEHTVKKHITSILSKLDMRNRKDLIVYTKVENNS